MGEYNMTPGQMLDVAKSALPPGASIFKDVPPSLENAEALVTPLSEAFVVPPVTGAINFVW